MFKLVRDNAKSSSWSCDFWNLIGQILMQNSGILSWKNSEVLVLCTDFSGWALDSWPFGGFRPRVRLTLLDLCKYLSLSAGEKSLISTPVTVLSISSSRSILLEPKHKNNCQLIVVKHSARKDESTSTYWRKNICLISS